MVVAPLSIQAERELVMDFIYPFFIDYNTVLLKLPDPAETKWKTLIQPFKTEIRLSYCSYRNQVENPHPTL